MKIQKLAFAFFFLFIGYSIIAQEEPIRPDINNSYITFDGFAAFAFASPRYTLGYVMPIHRRWMVGLDVGYGNEGIVPGYYQQSLVIGNDYKLFEIRPRLYYKLKPSSKFQPFLSAELFYINHRDTYVNNSEYLRDERYILVQNGGVNGLSQFTSYTSADYHRQKFGINFNIGLFLTLIDNVGMNIDVGLGIRNRNIEYSNVANPRPFNPTEDDGFLDSPAQYAIGNQLGANLSLNFKLFYKFDKGVDFFKNKE